MLLLLSDLLKLDGCSWNGFKAVKDEGSRELACDVWEETPSMIVERDTFANMYHGMPLRESESVYAFARVRVEMS